MTDQAGDSENIPPNFKIRWPSLRFTDPDTEKLFTGRQLEQSLPIVRLFLVAAGLMYGAFGILDVYIIPEASGIAWIIRFGIVCPMLFGMAALSFSPIFIPLAQSILMVAMFAAGFGVIVMTAFAHAPGNSLYYAGLFLVVVIGATLVRLRWTRSTGVSLVLVALYAINATWINPLPINALTNNIFFLISAIVTVTFTSHLQEFLIRRDFANAEMLRLEKTRAVELLRAANAANKAKGDFLAIVSHELRTPLNAILGFSEVMQRRMFGPVGSEKYIGYVDDIHQAADHLLNIVTDILDLSKAEVGKLSLNEQEISLPDTLAQCCRLVREKAAEGRLLLEIEPHREPALLRADARLVKQVFINLLSNAIKFTDPGGNINVSLTRAADGGWTVSFADTGVGIAEDDRKRILEPFVQVESAFARKRGGAGLGLPLAKKVVELHGGSLSIDSKLGLGTTVSVHFPADRTILSSEEEVYGAA